MAIQLIFKLEFMKEEDAEEYTCCTNEVLESLSNMLEVEQDFLLRALTQTNILTEGDVHQQQVFKTLLEARKMRD